MDDVVVIFLEAEVNLSHRITATGLCFVSTHDVALSPTEAFYLKCFPAYCKTRLTHSAVICQMHIPK